MKPKDLETYDAYPLLLHTLARVARDAIAPLPVEDMLRVCDRMTLTGVYTTASGPAQVSTELVQAQRRLIETAVAFRDAYVATMKVGT